MPKHEEYSYEQEKIPFTVRSNIFRTPLVYTKTSNWHEDIEIEYFKKGYGKVLLDGKEYSVEKGDIIVVNSNVIHQLIPSSEIEYSCIIISGKFCVNADFNYKQQFVSHIKDQNLADAFLDIENTYFTDKDNCKVLKLQIKLLKILMLLKQNYISNEVIEVKNKPATQRIKDAIIYIRENYCKKLTLEEIANKLYISKFLLSRDFKKITNQTVIEYVNAYRCKMVAEKILNGSSVSNAAFSCGFENMSFFAKTFKKYFNCLPSQYKKRK